MVGGRVDVVVFLIFGGLGVGVVYVFVLLCGCVLWVFVAWCSFVCSCGVCVVLLVVCVFVVLLCVFGWFVVWVGVGVLLWFVSWLCCFFYVECFVFLRSFG
jgi:hypothetical protein